MKSHSKAPRGLVALGSAAVIAVYAAGFVRTRSAAARFAEVPALRRPAAPSVAGASRTPAPPAGLPSRPIVAPVRSPVKKAVASVRSTAAAPLGSLPSPATAATASSAFETTAPVPEASVAAPAAEARLTEMPTKAISAESPVAAQKSPYRDGAYSGWGSSRHGDIEATVVIADGRIASAAITRCLTRYSCSWIAHLPGQVVSRQSAEVDYVSGATQSTDAFYYAVVDALSKAKG